MAKEKIAGLLLGLGKPKAGGGDDGGGDMDGADDESMESEDEAVDEACGEAFDAVKAGDRQAFCDALRSVVALSK